MEMELAEPRATVLLVEDEGFVREVTCEILRSAGYRVLKAGNAREAMQAFQCHREEVQLLLTDVVMPGQNGRDLARDLRTICPGLKTLFISGYAENVVTRHGPREHDVFYLPKPFSVRSLMRKVSQALSRNGRAGVQAQGERQA
jgi:CheY-like chemotaxis protein